MGNMRRVLVIGLDGVPFSLIKAWTAEGIMPNLAALMKRGTAGGLMSTMPPTSAPSWSTFMTGMEPGKTGIFDFLYRKPGTYHFPPVNSRLRHGRPIWSIISAAGGTVGVVNVPIAYPVDKVNGFMISGWMTPHGANDYTYPREMADELNKVVGNYRIYPTETFSERGREAFFQASYDLLKMRTEANLYLMGKRPDFFMAVYFDTDRILHQLWHYLEPGHPWRRKGDVRDLSGEVKDYFRALDGCLGRLLERTDDETTVIIMSDHGMGAAHRFVVLNNWLLRAGFMALKRRPVTWFKKVLFRSGFNLRNIHILADRLGLAKVAEYRANYFVDHLLKRVFLSFNDVDWSRTTAYSFGRLLGSIYLNVRGRESLGVVEPGKDYERVRGDIVRALENFRDPATGDKIVGAVKFREEIYRGAQVEHAPDIIVWPAKPTDVFFGLADFGAANLVDTVYRYSGMHRDEGLLIAAGPRLRRGGSIEGSRIADMAPTILHIMGLPVPSGMDGRVLGGLFEPGFLEGRPVVMAGETPEDEVSGTPGYTDSEEREIMSRLGDLGYLG